MRQLDTPKHPQERRRRPRERKTTRTVSCRDLATSMDEDRVLRPAATKRRRCSSSITLRRTSSPVKPNVSTSRSTPAAFAPAADVPPPLPNGQRVHLCPAMSSRTIRVGCALLFGIAILDRFIMLASHLVVWAYEVRYLEGVLNNAGSGNNGGPESHCCQYVGR